MLRANEVVEGRDMEATCHSSGHTARGNGPPSRRAGIASRRLQRVGAVLFGAALFFALLHFYTLGNDFTYEYHADEPGKIRQVMTGQRNYNHPQLMLELTHHAVQWRGTPAEAQAVVETGRWVSAVMTALAATALAWVGFSVAGWPGMLLVGASVGLSPALFTYAHYMKEDASLIGGVALTVLASRLVWISGRSPWGRAGSVILLGIGCAAAVSGKYVGIVALALAIPVAVLAPGTRGVMRVIWPVVMAAYFLAATLAINHRVFDDYERFRDSLNREREHAVTHHTLITMERPNTFFLARFSEETMLHTRVLAAVYLALLGVLVWKQRRWWDVMVVLLAGLFLFVLSMSVIPFNRYFLPVAMLTYLFAGLGAAWVVELVSGRCRGGSKEVEGDTGRGKPGRRCAIPPRGVVRVGLTLAALAMIVPVQGMRCWDYLGQFRDDSRARLRVWMAEHIPPGTRVVQDTYSHLHRRGDHREGQFHPRPRVRLAPQRGQFAATAGSLPRLRRQGVEYAIVCDLSYRRFFHSQVKGFEGYEAEFERRREWYRTLFDEYELVWESAPEHPMYAFTNPTIRVYRLNRVALEE